MLVCCYFYLLPSKADESDIVTTSPEIADFNQGIITYGICNGGTSHLNILSGGPEGWGETTALQWGACSDTFAMTMAINEALKYSETGISLDKIHYKWKWINGCYNITRTNGEETWCATDLGSRLDENFQPTGEYADQFDTLSIVVTLTDANGNIVETKNYDYDTWYHWAFENEHSSNEIMDDEAYWQVTEDHIELFNHLTGQGTIYTPNQLGDISFVANGQDKGHWDGYYGPVLKDGEMWFTYRNNPCDLNTLYSPTCEGYATAYATHLYNEACASNALYDLGCSGYQSAYRNQQCSINPLYEQTCPGYETAYLDQQCNLDTLYSVECPLYQIAYLEQQCDIDTQYDVSCMGYVDPVVEEIQIADPVQEIIAPSVTVNPYISNITTLIIPQIVLPEIEVFSEDVTTESLEIEIAAIEAELNEPIIKEDVEESTSSDGDSGDSGGDKAETKESTEQKETEQSESEVDGKSEESSNDETETKDDGGRQMDSGKDTGSEDGDGNDKEVDENEDINEAVEPEKDVVRPKKKEENSSPTEAEKKNSRKEKIRRLIADKVNSLTKKVEEASTLEEQVAVQSQLAALIAFVPDFDYSEIAVPDTYFYPPEPTVDHAFSRFFLNDPTFGAMENLQYPSLRK